MAGHVVDRWTTPDPTGAVDRRGRLKRVPGPRWGSGKRWRARYVDPTGRQRERSFDTKDAAEAFVHAQDVSLRDGRWVDPAAGRDTVGAYADRWLASGVWGTSTRTWYQAIVAGRLADRWGDVPVAQVTRAAAQEWIGELTRAQGTRGTLSPQRVRAHAVVLRAVLQHAVDNRAIPANPAAALKLPTIPKRRPTHLQPAQVAAVVTALRTRGDRHVALGLVLAFGGLRFGEAVGLRSRDLQGRTLHVRGGVTEVGGRRVETAGKTHRERSVPLPPSVAELVASVADPDPDGPLLPAPKGGQWWSTSWRRVWLEVCAEAGVEGARPHDLRHTAASLAISSGANVKAVQRMLGHATASMTLDLYGHLLDGELEAVADRLDGLVPRA